MSPSAVTDGVALFTSKSDDRFSHLPRKMSDEFFSHMITTPSLSAFPGDRLSSVLVNSAAKNIDFN